MKRKASISHGEANVRRLRKDPDFAAEYLKAALEDADEPRAAKMSEEVVLGMVSAQRIRSKASRYHRFDSYADLQR